MNIYLITAGLLSIVTSLVHSVLGEILIFRHLRHDGVVPTLGGTALKERQIRIIWASWHVVSALGFGLGGLLISLAFAQSDAPLITATKTSFAIAMAVSSLLVLWGTCAKHPGWIALGVIAWLLCLA